MSVCAQYLRVILFVTVGQRENETGELVYVHTYYYVFVLLCACACVCVSARPLKYPVDSNQIRDDVSSQQTDQ